MNVVEQMECSKVSDFQGAVYKAVDIECRSTPTIAEFVIIDVREVHKGVRVRLGAPGRVDDEMAPVIDEAFKFCKAAWVDGHGLERRVPAILDDLVDDEIALPSVSSIELIGVRTLVLERHNFLLATKTAWRDEVLAGRALYAYQALQQPKLITVMELGHLAVTDNLSTSQKAALNLPNYDHGWLFGPPGTGKTHTTSTMLAAYLIGNPRARVLVVGVANAPLCELICRLDDGLKNVGRNDLRPCVRRYGSGVSREIRDHRAHLLPDGMDGFWPNLRQERSVTWDPEVPMGEGPSDARVVAMTISTAISKIGLLARLPMFDLLVIEEASQAPLAQTILLNHLARACVYAGDPRQLSPVTKSEDPSSQYWMGTSPMHHMPEAIRGGPVAWLHEQRRMGRSICNLVSDLSYGGQLVTAQSCLANPVWVGHRRFSWNGCDPDQELIRLVVPDGHGAKRRCWRQKSIDAIVRAISAPENARIRQHDYLVMAPFRDQVHAIRKALAKAGYPDIRVATVHKVQGKEARIVLFDPVMGQHPFLKMDEARRLLNVAFSRAQAKLVLVASESDLAHPVLRRFAQAATN